MSGILYIVSTPLGNLEDITLRAVRILKEVDLIACEDTRRAGKLMKRYDIGTALTSYHEYNEEEKSRYLVSGMLKSKNVALISDAGTPLVSDPGYRLVNLAIENGIGIVSVPGPSAVFAALTCSGLPTDRFCFLGFLPKTSKKLEDFLSEIKEYPQTLILYDTARRIEKSLSSVLSVLGDRKMALCRELTKLHEEILRGAVSEILEILKNRGEMKGEITLVIDGLKEDTRKNSSHALENAENRLKKLKKMGLSMKDAVKVVNDDFDIPKNTIYGMALTIWGN